MTNKDAEQIVAQGDNITYPSMRAARHVRFVMRAMIKDETEMLNALIDAHRQVDFLIARLCKLDIKFKPSQTEIWPGVVSRHDLIKRFGGKL